MSVDLEEEVIDEIKVEKPKDFKVIFHNDEKTTFEFVIAILIEYYGKSFDDASILTTKIHNDGQAVVGIYIEEIAEKKANDTIRAARFNGYPLTVTIEPID